MFPLFHEASSHAALALAASASNNLKTASVIGFAVHAPQSSASIFNRTNLRGACHGRGGRGRP